MIAKSVCTALAAALLAALVLAFGGYEARAEATKTAVFAGGCFWCVEDAFDHVDGVTETVSG
ncbi:MAG TPA: peptide-methionine (S)-S-oxide reductase, partial [Methyloceanibacter sp.]|nr:peptide-methionine (S)-S-oxide reductase [Methyloceanibacter sp.]